MHCVFSRCRVKTQVKTLQGATKRFSSSYFNFFSPPNGKRSTTKAFPGVSLVSLTLRAGTLF